MLTLDDDRVVGLVFQYHSQVISCKELFVERAVELYTLAHVSDEKLGLLILYEQFYVSSSHCVFMTVLCCVDFVLVANSM